MILRAAGVEELAKLQALEQKAGLRFAEVGLVEVAEGPNLPLEALDRARREGLLWVASEPGGTPCGFLAARLAGAWLHVEELDVDPARQGTGVASGLLQAAMDEAGLRGLKGLSLTTFEHVPWNAPYYLRRGFEVMEADHADAALQEVWEQDRPLRALGPRVLMVNRRLPSGRS